MSEGLWISLFAMMVSLLAMVIQLICGVLNFKRAARETERQIAETKKQEVMHVVAAEETYKAEVRALGRSVVRAMSRAQQFAKIDPTKFVTSDYDLHRAETVSVLRGLLDKAKWLFPNLAVPSRDRSVINIRKLRKQFVREMRRAVDPHVRGEEIERTMAEVSGVTTIVDDSGPFAEIEPAPVIGNSEAQTYRKLLFDPETFFKRTFLRHAYRMEAAVNMMGFSRTRRAQ